MTNTIYTLILCILSVTLAAQDISKQILKGMTVVAPPSPIGAEEMLDLVNINTEWIALVPYGFSKLESPEIRYDLDRQWWGEKAEGIIKCIELAHKQGLKVMLKPQVFIHGSWVGDVDFETEEEWTTWENNYSSFINFYGDIAKKHGVELFCIGTEYKLAAQKRPAYWTKLIADFRSSYDGLLTYSSNWDGFEQVPFWDQLDFVGLSSYFPLTDQSTPTINYLKNAWKPIKKRLRKFYRKTGKPILFTEYGYMSIDGCAGKAWLIEKDRENRAINEKAQSNAYHALLESHWEEPYWAGGFLWKWFPAGMGHEGYPEKDYTPQDKEAEKVIQYWYGK